MSMMALEYVECGVRVCVECGVRVCVSMMALELLPSLCVSMAFFWPLVSVEFLI